MSHFFRILEVPYQNLANTKMSCSLRANFSKNSSKIFHRHIEGRDLLNAREIDFQARHGASLQCMRFKDLIALHFKTNMSMAVVHLDFEEAFGAKRHLTLMHKVYEITFSTNAINLISSSLSTRKPALSVEGDMYEPRDIQAVCLGVPPCPQH
jgi:hypothetical protein